ncbi:MAG: helix-turn-helix domain-containing protein [Desulfovibrionaceae bacterium]|nr:helix-turn-helix domain-containing protein [Desulfovibrionaceae bacterium]
MTDGRKTTAEALDYWIKKRGMTQAQLAEKTDLAQNYISQIKTGSRYGSIEALQKIADALDLSLPEFFARKDASLPELVYVQKVKARPSAGSGSLETDSEHAGYYSFHSSFIARKRGTPDSMKIFEVSGDSMSPTLGDSDLIMINMKEADVRTGHIYLLRIEDELLVKRLETRPGGIILIRSDNPDYETITVSRNDEHLDMQIFGRMVWSCREY